MTKIELEKNSVMASFPWCHRYVIEKRHQTNFTRYFNFGPLPIKIYGHAIVPSCFHTHWFNLKFYKEFW